MPPELRQLPERIFTDETVAEMYAQMFRYAPEVRARAEAIIRQAGIGDSPCGKLLRAAALYRWVQEHMTYLDDHLAVQQIVGPAALLEEIDTHGTAFGNCVEYTVLLGALLVSVGIDVEIVTTSARDDGEWDHTYLWLRTECPPDHVFEVLGLVDPVAADAIHGAAFGWELDADAGDEVIRKRIWPAPAWAAERAGM